MIESNIVQIDIPMSGRTAKAGSATVNGLTLNVENTLRQLHSDGKLDILYNWDLTNAADEDISDWFIVCYTENGQMLYVGGLNDESIAPGENTYSMWQNTVTISGDDVCFPFTFRAYGYTDDDICVVSNRVYFDIPADGEPVADLCKAKIEMLEESKPANGEFYVAGETVKYRYSICNTQGGAMLDVRSNDELIGELAGYSLILAETCEEFASEYVVTEVDAQRGYIENIAYVTWKQGDEEANGTNLYGTAVSEKVKVSTAPLGEENDYYTITFDMNVWDACPTMTIRNGATNYTLPEPEEKYGYEFTGWCVTSSKSNEPNARANKNVRKFAPGEPITANLTLQAQYRQTVGYTLTLDAGDGCHIEGMSAQTCTIETDPDGRAAVYPKAESSEKKVYFEGWYTGEGERVDNAPEHIFQEDTTLYAQWSSSATIIIK